MQHNSESIAAVVRAVVQQLEQMKNQKPQEVQDEASSRQGKIVNTPEVLILAKRESSGFRRIAARFTQNREPVLCTSSDELTSEELQEPGSRFAKIIVSVLCPVGMADLALGRASGREMITLLALLLKGYSVEVGEYQYHQYQRSAAPQLYRLYQQYEKKLAEYGLTLLEFGERAEQKRALDSKAKTLITEEKIIELARNNRELVFAHGTLLTALAKDYAREHGITLTIT